MSSSLKSEWNCLCVLSYTTIYWTHTDCCMIKKVLTFQPFDQQWMVITKHGSWARPFIYWLSPPLQRKHEVWHVLCHRWISYQLVTLLRMGHCGSAGFLCQLLNVSCVFGAVVLCSHKPDLVSAIPLAFAKPLISRSLSQIDSSLCETTNIHTNPRDRIFRTDSGLIYDKHHWLGGSLQLSFLLFAFRIR